MSRSINESVQLLSQTLENCKTNLTEKQVADVDNIKISDVDEKIAEIQAGGGDFKSTVEGILNDNKCIIILFSDLAIADSTSDNGVLEYENTFILNYFNLTVEDFDISQYVDNDGKFAGVLVCESTKESLYGGGVVKLTAKRIQNGHFNLEKASSETKIDISEPKIIIVNQNK